MHSPRFHWNRSLLCAATVAIPVVLLGLLMLQLSPVAALEEPVPFSTSSASGAIAGPNGGHVITIGVAAPLIGGPDFLGWPVANAVQLAISQTNAAGGISIGDIPYTLVMTTANDGCSATLAPGAAEALIKAGALGVIGHVCSGATMAAQSVYYAAGVPMISPTSSNPQITQQGYSTTFRVAPQDTTAASTLAAHFRQVLRRSKTAVVDGPAPIGAYSQIYSNTFVALGGIVTSYHRVNSTDEFASVLSDIKLHDGNPTVIFYSDWDPARSGQFSKAAYDSGMTDVTLAWASADNDESALAVYATSAGTSAVEDDTAVLFVRRFQDMPGWPAFLADYQAAHFEHYPDSPGSQGVLAYDAARILIAAMARSQNPTPAAIRGQVAATGNFPGAVGTYVGFDSHGDVIPQWTFMERYQDGRWIAFTFNRSYLPVVLRPVEG